jgi:hypothetical protein
MPGGHLPTELCVSRLPPESYYQLNSETDVASISEGPTAQGGCLHPRNSPQGYYVGWGSHGHRHRTDAAFAAPVSSMDGHEHRRR